ncbi:MAG: TetR/AcrR family transcriptional regulator [Anaerolineae bacterium]
MSSQNQTDQKIFEAAESLITEQGPSFTMDQLEAKAKISRATIYRRVGNKEALLKRLAEEKGETFEKADMRLNILKAARIVFGREGLVASTMDQISKEAGVGVATVYRHFGDKEKLLKAFIEEMTPRTAVRSLALQPTENVQADLEKIIGIAAPFFYENRDVLRIVFMGSRSEREYLESLRHRSDSTLGRLTNYFEAQIAAGRIKAVGQPGELALALMGMILSFTMIGPIHYGTQLENPERMSKLIVSLFLNGLIGGAE